VKFLAITLFCGLFMSSFTAHADKTYYKDSETIAYNTIETLTEEIEIREYPASLAVMSKGSSDNGAFRLLFNYISGENKARSEIAMTSPVEVGNEKVESAKIAMTSPVEITSSNTMMFFLPSKYNADNAPEPSHPAVSLVEVPARKVAVIRYSGFNNDDKRQAYANTLLRTLQERSYEIAGKPSYLGYDSPFTLPWNKRHEVIIPVK
jgi:hypothetical protein